MVATELLDRIFRRHQPIGEALRAVREMYGRTSPTFYSYLFYGDVTAQIRQTPHSRAPYAVYGTSLARSDEFDWRPTNAT